MILQGSKFLQKCLFQATRNGQGTKPGSKAGGLVQQGFTLLELLIVVAIGSLVVTTLLSLVVELTGTEQKEAVRTETQREMQMALDYIVADIREAVYIYDGSTHPDQPASTPRYWNFIPAAARPAGAIPIVAFWKPKPINLDSIPLAERPPLPQLVPTTPAPNCATEAPFAGIPARVRECNNVWAQRRAYSLVVYMQYPNKADFNTNNLANNPNTNGNGFWKGDSRIVRFEMFKYRNPLRQLIRTPGFADPAEIGSDGFERWPFLNGANCQNVICNGIAAAGAPTADSGVATTLVDFVDIPNADATITDRKDRRWLPPNITLPTCPLDGTQPGYDPNNRFIDASRNIAAGRPGSNSFKVCIRDTRPLGISGFVQLDGNGNPVGLPLGEPQDIQIYLRGDARGRGGLAADGVLPTLQTRISMRGIVDRGN